MLKKISVVTSLSVALLFGGVFSSSAEAQNHQQQPFTYKVYYSINGNGVHMQELQNILQKYLGNYDWKTTVKQPTKQPAQQEQGKGNAGAESNSAPTAPAPQQPKQEQPKQEQPKQEQNQQLSQYEQEVINLTNQERAKYGLPALKADVELSKVAREKSADMARNNYFSHTSPTYGSPFDMMRQFGISYQYAGENIAKGQRSPQEVVNAWMNSEGHRANILSSNFTHIGVGYVEQGNVWTQMFISK